MNITAFIVTLLFWVVTSFGVAMLVIWTNHNPNPVFGSRTKLTFFNKKHVDIWLFAAVLPFGFAYLSSLTL